MPTRLGAIKENIDAQVTANHEGGGVYALPIDMPEKDALLALAVMEAAVELVRADKLYHELKAKQSSAEDYMSRVVLGKAVDEQAYKLMSYSNNLRVIAKPLMEEIE